MTLVVVCYFFMLGIVISSRDLVCFAWFCCVSDLQPR